MAERRPRPTIRELQQRKIRAEEAYARCRELVKMWENDGWQAAVEQGREPERWAEVNAEIRENLALFHSAFPNERFQVRMVRWMSWLAY